MDIEKIKAAVLVAIGVTDTRPMREQLKSPRHLGCKPLRDSHAVQEVELEMQEAVERETVQRAVTEFCRDFITTLDITPLYLEGLAIVAKDALMRNGCGEYPSYVGQQLIKVKGFDPMTQSV